MDSRLRGNDAIEKPMPHSPLSRYEQLIEHCEISRDGGQEQVVHALQTLYNELQTPEAEKSLLSKWFGKSEDMQAPRGIYLWGGVGRGKSMLMDMFFHSLQQCTKQRVHFHGFMLDVHRRIHHYRAEDYDDPLMQVAKDIIRENQVLCFDELQVHDIADASILARLFSALFEAGITIIFTSNRPPEDLYKDGLQRERFLPFIALIRAQMDVMEIMSEKDYRQNRVEAIEQRYLTPANDASRTILRNLFDDMIAHENPHSVDVPVQGRIITVAKTCREVAWFTFDDLCTQAYGASDYLELATLFKVFFIADIPRMTPENRNEAKRFVTLVDVLYEARALLCCTADAQPEALYESGDGTFEFERTASRLREMMAVDYGTAPVAP